MTEFEIVEVEPQQAAVIRAEVPMAELPSVFDRGFHAVMAAVAEQGLAVTGPPFGFYPSLPGDTVEVAVGFPVSGPVAPAGEVTGMELPGGRAVQAVHVGPYDTLERTYGELMAWVQGQGLRLATGMWESYLSDPAAEPDPATWRTQITWPLET
jgi:effector-binding domain-containing protein